MPYLASPPDLPPAIAIASPEPANRIPAVTALPSEPPSVQTGLLGSFTRPAPPAPSKTQLTTVNLAQQQTSQSEAKLLGTPVAIDYSQAWIQQSQIGFPSSPTAVFDSQLDPATTTVQAGFTSAIAQNRSSAQTETDPAQFWTRAAVGSGTVVKTPEIFFEPTPSESYSFSGLSKQVPSKQVPAIDKSTLMPLLDQVLNLNALQGNPTALKVLVRRDSTQAQATDKTPTTIPFPAGPASSPLSPSPISPLNPSTPQDSSGQSTPPKDSQQPKAPGAGVQTNPPGTGGVVELTADRQTYDAEYQVFTAEGNVLMRFQGALLSADRLQVNLKNRNAVAEGNAVLTRGSQILRGQRFEYNFVQGVGAAFTARGEIYLPTSSTDLAISVQGGPVSNTVLGKPVGDRVTADQPPQNVTNPGSLIVGVGLGRDLGRLPGGAGQGGMVNRLRFEAERIDFTPEGWDATNIEITNDPFSPPELILKAERAKLTRLSPLRDEVRATRPRLVFEQRVSIPLISRIVLDRRQRQPPIIQFGFDNDERGGLFAERTFEVITTDQIRLTITPQVFLQRAVIDTKTPFDAQNFGLKAKLSAAFSSRTQIQGALAFTSLNLNQIENQLRASLRAQQLIGDHSLSLEYSYRDRLFNGSLGFQTVQSSLGIVFTSPTQQLGNTGISYDYQVGFQNINSDTDRVNLLPIIRTNNRTNLSRFQATASASRGFTLWKGKALPATATEGLRYSPVPIIPYINFGVGLRGTLGSYTNGDSQNNLTISVGIAGQFGHFSKPYLDYTGFSLGYSQVIGSGQSPFLFDRAVDTRTISAGLTQQIYGPFRFGIQTSFNLDSNQEISTDYILEYSRRAYSLVLRYNPVLSIGSLNLRISDFNWSGGSEPFDASGVTPVEGGVRRTRN